MSNVSQWSTTAASNNASPPNGWPENQSPSSVNDCARENMAALARWYGDTKGALTSAGSSNAYTLTTNSSHASLAAISTLVFMANHTNTGAATLAVDGLAAKSIKNIGQALVSGDLVVDTLVVVAYNPDQDCFDLLSPAGNSRTTLNDFQEFTSTGTWTKPSGAGFVYVEAIGPGGGGGNSTSTSGGGGGGGGEFMSALFRASELGATETVTVPAGGAGAGNGTNNAGVDGSNTTFGSHLTARGGRGGTSGGSYVTVPGAKASTGSTELLSFVSPQAGYGGARNDTGGNTINGGAGGGGAEGDNAGGTSVRGGNGGAGRDNAGVPGVDGSAPGGGGGGSCNDGGGGAGGAGRVRVWTWN